MDITKASGILLLPNKAYSLALLEDEEFGSHPPIAGEVSSVTGKSRWVVYDGETVAALVLAWRMKAVRAGLDRLDWAQHHGFGVPSRGRQGFIPHIEHFTDDGICRAWMNAWLACHAGDHVSGWSRRVGVVVLVDDAGDEIFRTQPGNGEFS